MKKRKFAMGGISPSNALTMAPKGMPPINTSGPGLGSIGRPGQTGGTGGSLPLTGSVSEASASEINKLMGQLGATTARPMPSAPVKPRVLVNGSAMGARPGLPRPSVLPKPPGGMAKGGRVGSASKRADGCAQRGKTKGKMY